MPVSRSFELAQSLQSDGTIESNMFENLETGNSLTVANTADLPLTGNHTGRLALITSLNKFLIWNGTGWYQVSTVT